MNRLLISIAVAGAIVCFLDHPGAEGAAAASPHAPRSGTSSAPGPGTPPAGEASQSSQAPPGSPDGSPTSQSSEVPPPDVHREIERSKAAQAKAAALRSAAAEHPKEVRYQTDCLSGLIDLDLLDEALGLGPKIVQEFPKSPEVSFQLGRALTRNGQFDLARLQFQRTIGLDPQNASAHAWAGRIDLARGDLRSAETALRRALAIDHDQREARGALAEVLERSGQYNEAVEVLETGGAKGGRKAELTGRATVLRALDKRGSYAMPAGFKGVSVPFKTSRGYPPLVKARLGDSLEKLLVLDTGSNEVVLTPDTARALGLPVKGTATIRDEDGREYPTPAYVVLDRVSIGGLTVGLVPARVSPGLRYPSEEIGGVIGRDFLRHFRLGIDYPSKTLTLARAEGPALGGVPFDIMGAILLEGWDGDRQLGKFALDTSSYTPGAMDFQFVASRTGLTVFDKTVHPISEGPYLFKFTMPSLKVGGVEFRDFPATAVDFRLMSRTLGVRVCGVVGHSLLRSCRLQIDFKNQRLVLEKSAPPSPDAGTAD